MKVKSLIFSVLVITLAGCSVQKHLPKGETIYRGANIRIEKHEEVKTSNKNLKSSMRIAIQPKPNKFLLGHPWKVWWWYKIGPPRREKGLKAFLRNRLGEPPVFGSRVNAENSAVNIVGRMENLGYFHSTAQGDTSHKKYFTEANYTVQVQPRYHISEITWVSDSSAILKTLQRIQGQSRSVLKVGNPYNLDDISAERTRIDLTMKNRGYYYFNPDYLMAYADSSVGDRKVRMYLNIKQSTPEIARHPFRINRINVYPNYSLTSDALDTSRHGFEFHDSLYIRDTTKLFKPGVFTRTITYRPGRLYSSRSQNTTLNRFITLGSFKFVKNRFEIADTAAKTMDVYYYLTPAKKKSIQAGIDGFTKENNYIGTQVSVNWKNRNAFRGAEQLNIRGYVGIEISSSDSFKSNNNLRLGAEASLRVPRYVVPFLKIKENNLYPPSTNFKIGYELMRRQLFYTRNLFHGQYDFTWKPNRQKEIMFAPFSVSYLSATGITDTFRKQAEVSPALLLNVNSEAILGTLISYSMNRALRPRKNQWFFSTSLDVSGNLAGLISGAKEYREKEILGTPFAQYIKTDFEFRYTRKLSPTLDLANRLQLGIGLPYNNSRLLPFTKQYMIGGANSIRGFTVRTVGPGRYRPSVEDQRFFQTIGGDFKFLFNSEVRFPIAGQLKGAVFADIGNIWTKDTIQFGEASKLTKDWFKELAVASGFGIRFDATIILIRVDLGIPLRKPYLPEGERWVFKDMDISRGAWRRENLVLNIALGYPF